MHFMISFYPKSFLLSFYVFLERKSEKKRFWTFLERKSAENEENSKKPSSALSQQKVTASAILVTASRRQKDNVTACHRMKIKCLTEEIQ